MKEKQFVELKFSIKLMTSKEVTRCYTCENEGKHVTKLIKDGASFKLFVRENLEQSLVSCGRPHQKDGSRRNILV